MAKKRTRQTRAQARRRAQALANVPQDFKIVCAGDGEFQIDTIEAAEGETPKPRQFRMLAYTGGKMLLAGFSYPVIVDLSGLTIPRRSQPILRDHDPAQIVGHTNTVSNSGGSLKLTGTISGANAHAEEVAASSDAGFPWQSSIGARATRLAFVDEGETVTVNGRRQTGPLYVARSSILREVSFVAVGADSQTSAALIAAQAHTTHSTDTTHANSPRPLTAKALSMDFTAWLTAAGFNADDLTDAQTAILRASFDAEAEAAAAEPVARTTPTITATDPPAADDMQASRAALADETERVAAIHNICARYDNPRADQDSGESLEAHAIRHGETADSVELRCMRQYRPSNAPERPEADAAQIDAQAIEAALCLSVGLSEEIAARGLSADAVDRATGRQYRGMTIQGLMEANCRAVGKPFHGNRKSNEFIRAALGAAIEINAASGFSTLSLSNVLENVASKSLVASYQSIATTWSEFCKVTSLTDFKAHSRYRLDSTGAYRKIGKAGELKHAGLSDAKTTVQADTYGTIIALTRQMMIDDDLNAFLILPQLIGRMASTAIEEAAWVLLLSNPSSFFSSGNANLITGASSALDIGALTTGVQSFRDQVDGNGKPALVTPNTLLTGSALEITARELHSELRVQSDTTATKRNFAANPHVGLYNPVSSPYANNTAITDEDGKAISGQSSTKWWLFAAVDDRSAMVIGFLNGQQLPTIEQAALSPELLGTSFRSFHDWGISMDDPLAALQSNGG
jgi:hypothetical protein